MIGERLSEIRKDHGDTQADLASRLNVSLAAVRSWEQEKSSPSHEMLVNICKLYQVSSDYLLGLIRTDPYQTQRQREQLNSEELAEVQAYSEYLLWKRSMRAKSKGE